MHQRALSNVEMIDKSDKIEVKTNLLRHQRGDILTILLCSILLFSLVVCLISLLNFALTSVPTTDNGTDNLIESD